MKPLYRAWLARMSAGDGMALDGVELTGMAHSHALALGRHLTDPATRPSSLTYAEWMELARFATITRPLMRQLDTERGLAWLRSIAYTPSGRERAGHPFSASDLAVLGDAIAIRLAGYTAWPLPYRTDYKPVYRVESYRGLHLDYVVASTRSDAISGNGGGRIELRPAIERWAWYR